MSCTSLPFATNYTAHKDYQLYQQYHTQHLEREALAALERLHNAYPDQEEVTLLLADHYRKMGQCKEALPLYQHIPYLTPAQEGIGLCSLHQGKFAEAGQALAKVLAEDATHWRSINAFGVSLALTNQLPEALHYFTLADDLEPNNPQILNNYALAEAMQRNYTRAIPKLEKSLSLTPENSAYKKQIALNLALVYGASGKMELAEKTAKPYLSESALYHNMAVYALLRDDKAMAKEYLKRALSPQNYNQSSWDLLKKLEDL